MRNNIRRGLFDPRQSGQVWPEPSPDTNIPYAWGLNGFSQKVGAPIGTNNNLPDLTSASARRINVRLYEHPIGGSSFATKDNDLETPEQFVARLNAASTTETAQSTDTSSEESALPIIVKEDCSYYHQRRLYDSEEAKWILASILTGSISAYYLYSKKGEQIPLPLHVLATSTTATSFAVAVKSLIQIIK